MNWRGFKHWILPDHVAHLLLCPAILFQKWLLALLLYLFTLFYDVLEEQVPALKRLEQWAKK